MNWLQKEIRCTATESKIHVEEFAQYCNSVLASKRRMNIEQIGFFFLDFENNLCFEPRQDVNFLSSSFGLPNVSLNEPQALPEKNTSKKENLFTDRTVKEAATEPVQESISTSRAKPRSRRYLAYISLSVLVFGILLSLINLSGVQGVLHSALLSKSGKRVYYSLPYSNLDMEKPNTSHQLIVADYRGIARFEPESGLVFHVRTGSVPEKAHAVAHNKGTSLQGAYEIVFGCFAVKSNAGRFATRLERRNLNVKVTNLQDKHLFAVSLGEYRTKDEARTDLQKLREEFPSAWIKKLP